jgi:anti-sigma B factor antagonist
MNNSTNIALETIKDVTVVRFEAQRTLDAAHVEDLADQLIGLADAQAGQKLVLDFSHVRFLSSAMLGLLLRLRSRVREAQGQVVLSGLRPELAKLLRLTRVDRLFDLYENEQRAVSSLALAA